MKDLIYCLTFFISFSVFSGGKLQAWKLAGKTLPADCFTVEWQSKENFKAIEKKFDFKFRAKDKNNIGLYLGKEIDSFDRILPRGPNDGVAIIQKLSVCVKQNKYEQSEAFYFQEIQAGFCSKLSPDLEAKFTRCREVMVENPLDDQRWFGLYAEGEVKNFGHSIIPLKYFTSLEEMKTFTEGHRVSKNP